MVGTSIGAAEPISMQEKLPTAETAAIAAEDFRNSRRPMLILASLRRKG